MTNPSDQQIEFYWRPGCPFCMTLERSLNKLNVPYAKRNIWENPADAAFVRSVANGNEVVPTVRIGGTSLVNPSAQQVVTTTNAELPGLLESPTQKSAGFRRRLRR
ncbi:MAG: NrdH-redoxin [Acidimicrobiales bacterium]|nr:NrdH-redoxin [Acidimicrobiales bacterium]